MEDIGWIAQRFLNMSGGDKKFWEEGLNEMVGGRRYNDMQSWPKDFIMRG